ncbi:hypothetical protein PPYR_13857 [Photinus pyralis]|uniref:Protein sleepless n=1 Tax=Photinus pyralis TaxID=7054 RepID=A0A1Y1KSR6_PHOPY|nr:uncharacterized protein LOC116179297 [Photinus pyralis]XP_031354914.1 uncharacterized protein LOC116179297 [Photinus pyralis]XP_031354916.1 uncharacterized protein LOC116179297 [Photinus pyralis]KAB0794237.1 hypothetical protein PPYR_13857 [Photinus pyralis]
MTRKYTCTTLMVILLLIHARTCFGLRCYKCDSQEIDGCLKYTKPKNYTCGSKMSYFRQVCEYSVLYDTEKKIHQVHSGCELINEKDPVDTSLVRSCIDTPSNIQVVECRVCDRDLCNSASGANVSWFVYFVMIYAMSSLR